MLDTVVPFLTATLLFILLREAWRCLEHSTRHVRRKLSDRSGK